MKEHTRTWINNQKADRDPVSDLLYAIVDNETMLRDGKVMSPTITYMPLHLAQPGSGGFSTYDRSLKLHEKVMCAEVRSALNSWMYAQ